MQEMSFFLAFILFLEYNDIYINTVGVYMFKTSLKIYLTLLIANIMAFFIVVSFSVISTIAFSKEIGYEVYGTATEDGEVEKLYEYYYEDGEDIKSQEYTDKGYTITTKQSIRSQPSKSLDIIFKIISGSICVFLVAAFLNNKMWTLGDKDKVGVKYKGQKENLNKGFIIGLIATIPAILLLLVLTVFKSGFTKLFPMFFFNVLNTYLFCFINLLTNNAAAFGDLVYWQIFIIFLMLLIVPLICGVSYILGYKGISIGEKFIYKKKVGK